MSGATLTRGRLADGSPVIVKRSSPSTDVFQRRLGHDVSLEHLLWQDGTLSRLPSKVESAVLGTWVEGDVAVIVMKDLGDAVLESSHAFSRDELVRLLGRVDSLHRANVPSVHSTSLLPLLALFSAPKLRADGAPELAREVDLGWSIFADLVPGPAASLLGLVADPRPIVSALAARRAVLCHGDIAAVNMAWQGDALILLDWGQAFRGPPALEVARFLPSGLIESDVEAEVFLEDYREVAGAGFDSDALDLSILATVTWYGWRKSIDASTVTAPERRARELKNLEWLCDRAARGLRLI